jgi:hypothetical protein
MLQPLYPEGKFPSTHELRKWENATVNMNVVAKGSIFQELHPMRFV